MNFVEIRPFHPKQISALTRDLGLGVCQQLQQAAAMGWGWSAWMGEIAAGWATAVPLPGLDGVVELDGAVSLPFRRRGVAAALLAAVRNSLQNVGVWQLSYPVNTLESEAAQFLRRSGFQIGHEEWEMARPTGALLPPTRVTDVGLITLPRREAMAAFLPLYDRSFGELPWYQPFSMAEVAATLAHGRDIRFLQRQGALIGFAWLRADTAGVVRIEPIGIVPEWQGQGYGRYLLHSLLHEIGQQDVTEVRLGVWRGNETAVNLYQALGFHHVATTTYLYLNLRTA